MKMCSVCQRALDFTSFFKDRSKKDGHCSTCKVCSRKRADNWKEKNRDKVERYFKNYYAKNKREKTCQEKQKRRLKDIETIKRYPERRKARQMVNNHIIAGKIKRMPCEVCGNEKSQGHHCDYSKPLEVIWLCYKHHKEWHRVNKEEYERINNGN